MPNQEKRQNQIAAYFDGEMTPGETADFEQQMKTNESLRQEAEQWQKALEAARDWIQSEAPGTEHLPDLPVPSVAKQKNIRRLFPIPKSEIRIPKSAWRAAAAAAIFIAGFIF
ncbi:MAG: hypothetical protein ABIH23_21335, partial [bacterium]